MMGKGFQPLWMMGKGFQPRIERIELRKVTAFLTFSDTSSIKRIDKIAISG